MFLCYYLILNLILTLTSAYKILCLFPYPGKSHHLVFEPLLQELANRGHQLTVVSFFPSEEPHPNRRDVSLVGLAPINIEVVDMNEFLSPFTTHLPVVLFLARSNLQLCEKLLNSKVFEEFVQARGDYDVILTEHFNSDCMLGLIHNYGLPSVGLKSCAIMPWTPSRVGAPNNPSYVPGMTLYVTDNMSFFERIKNAFFLYFYLIWYEVNIRWAEQRILERKLGRRLPPLEDVGKNASVVLVNTHHSWNGVKALPPSVVEVGGIHLHNKTVQPLPKRLEFWLSESKDGFIIFSFGSLIRGSTLPPHMVQAFINVFRTLTQKVIWKWEGDPLDVPDNVKLMRWLPQYDLLNHPSCRAFITHAGLLGMTEALAAGVPMLTVPVLGDQFGNAAHAKRAGIAEVLQLNEIDEATLKVALKKVLSEEMRSQVKLVNQMWTERPTSPMDTAVFYIERTAKFGGLDLSCHSRWMNWIQLAYLDVLALVLVIFGALVVLVQRSFRRKVKTS